MHDETDFNRVCQSRISEFIVIFQKVELNDKSRLNLLHYRFVIHFVFFKSSFQTARARENNFIILKLIKIECNYYMT